MTATKFTIYLLKERNNFESTVTDIVHDYNLDYDEENKKFHLKNSTNYSFKNITNYKMYVRSALSSPNWKDTMDLLVEDISDVENKNNSFALFVQLNNYIFVITGGSGYVLIDSEKQFNFGLELVSRIIGENDNVIKNVGDKTFSGNRLSGNNQYMRKVSIISQQYYNNMFKKMELALPKHLIQHYLGIKIPINKSSYNFFAKDAIKLSKSITLEELDKLLLSITSLMNKQPSYSILPFYQLDNKNPLVKQLDALVENKFWNQLQKTVSSAEKIRLFIPSSEIYEDYYVKFPGTKKEMQYSDEQQLLSIIINKVLKNDNITIPTNFLKESKIIGKSENNEELKTSLFNCIDTVISHENTNYWLTEGEWYLFERDFIETLDKTYAQKIKSSRFLNLPQISIWAEGPEGDYNHSHLHKPDTFVLDRMLSNNIELCDLLIEEQGKLYFIHVKDGLDGDLRMLSQQIQQAMEFVTQDISSDDCNTLRKYYNNIYKKTKNASSNITNAAKTFIDYFTSENEFIEYIKNRYNKINFVFAYRPLISHNIYDSKTIKSFAAKFAIIDLINSKENFNFPLYFLEIERGSN